MSNKNTYFKKVEGGSKKESLQNGKTEAPVAAAETPPKPKRKKNISPSENGKSNNKKQKATSQSVKTPKSEKRQSAKKRTRIVESDDDDDSPDKKPAAKKRLISHDDSEDEWKAEGESNESEEEEVVESEESDEYEGSEEEEKKPTARNKASSKRAAPAGKEEKDQHSKQLQAGLQDRSWAHLSYDFLKPEKIRDADKRRPDHPDYNPRTVYVPPDFVRKLTPAMKQWWDVKAQHFDCVIFLKLGKVYHLYHMDAAIGVNELGLIFMKVDIYFDDSDEDEWKAEEESNESEEEEVVESEESDEYEGSEEEEKKPTARNKASSKCAAPAGKEENDHRETARSIFPEVDYARYAKVLLEKGYKVARVEETETHAMMQNRCNMIAAPTKFDRFVKREVCQISSKGTRMYLAIEGDATSSDNAYLLSITEKKIEGDKNLSQFGVCFVDTSLGSFCIGQFEDDRHKSELRTLLAHFPPAHVLLNKGAVSDETRNIVTNMASSAIVENLAAESEFLTASETLKTLNEKNYFGKKDENQSTEWPDVLVQATEGKDLRTPVSESELSLSALGACLWYLIDSKLDMQLMCTKNFSLYKSQGLSTHDKADNSSTNKLGAHMVLDATALTNMDVVANAETGGKEGTLLGKLDNCCTPFGKRLLRQWLCSPLCSVDSISKRQQAISSLMKMPAECEKARKLLKELPDIERLLMRISVYGDAAIASKHPDSRAIFDEDLYFSKKKFRNLVSLLIGFKDSLNIMKLFKGCADEEGTELLQRISCTKQESPNGQYPELKALLEFFESVFNPIQALNTGKLTPRPGEDPEFDAFNNRFNEINAELKQNLKKLFGRDVIYDGICMESLIIGEFEKCARKAPSFLSLLYMLDLKNNCIKLLSKMQTAKVEKKDRLTDINRRMFARFASSTDKWMSAMKCLAVLDVLLSLAKYGSEETTCMPQVKSPTPELQSFINIKNGRLPTTTLTDFIPNDTVVGVEGVRLLLLTGPNMGGKSTLMRQLGLIVIMAQIGCPVPADECSLTPVDRIFTRIGASDHILAGESTFFVEMSETSAILKHATQHSVILMDELGRGTTTFDGAAIASAVLESLISKQCCTIFSTHYHFLVEKYEKCPQVKLVQMACMEEGDNDEGQGGEAKVENVTFLYKLVPGACPSSHGFNAARLAGLPTNHSKAAGPQAAELPQES